MRKASLIIGAVLLATLVGRAEPLYLRHDPSGAVYGPFDTTPGSKITIGKTEFTVVLRGSTGTSVRQKLESIIIPQIEMRQANLTDVLDYLRKASAEFDKSDDPEGMKGINLILNIRDTDTVPLVTFTAREISIEEALKVVTQIGELTYRIEGNVVFVERRKRTE